MGPLAKKLIAEIEKAQIAGQPPEVLQTIARPGPIEVPKDLPPNAFVWLKSYQYLSKIAAGIMGSKTLRDFTETVRAADEEYLPYGPPDSPITDSFFFGWWAIDQPVGKKETIAMIVADVAERYGAAADEIERMRALAETHLRVVKIEARDGPTARLRDLVTNDELEVGLAAPWDGEVGQLWLARALPEMCFTPYALDGEDAEGEWRDYFGRQMGDASEEQLRARYRAHMRGDPPEHWLEYILAGYYEGNQHTLHLTGVPDRQESLPHAEQELGFLFDANEEAGARDRLVREMFLSDVALDALRDFMEARESFELEEIEPDEETLLDPMLIGYACFGLPQENGETFLESFLKDPPQDADPEELADLRATAAGWFSLFEIKHVKLDEGIELEDLLLNKTIWVEEQAATRQIGLGELLACWVQDHGGRLTLEGSNIRFPRIIAEPVRGLVQDYHASLEEKEKELPWRQRLGALVPIISALEETMVERPMVPEILNEDGEEMVFSQARYQVKKGVAAKLTGAGWSGEAGSFALFDEEDKLIASAEIEGDRLILFATSPAQLEKAKANVGALLGADAVHQNDVFEDAQVAVAAAMVKDEMTEDILSAEEVAELREQLEEELREWLDTPIPMLGDRTPREAVRSKRGKEDVQMMLLEQERMLADHEHLEEPIDFRPLWTSLGLEYPER